MNNNQMNAGRELQMEINATVQHQIADVDSHGKSLFRYKTIIAVILQQTVEEFKDYSLKEIVSCISDISENTDISPGLTISRETLHTENAEFTNKYEKRSYFDILFTVHIPKQPEVSSFIQLVVDIELQKSLKLPYRIESRGIYYLAREISSQLNYVFDDTTEYAKLKKAYTIWICVNDIPKKLQNTIAWYTFAPKKTFGIRKSDVPDANLMEMIIIRLGNQDTRHLRSSFIKFLYGIFDYSKHKRDFHRYVTTEDVHAEPDLEKELNAMDGAGMLIYKSAYKEAYDKAYSEAYNTAYNDAYSDAYSEAETDLTNTSIKRMLDNNLDDTTIQKILDVPIERIEKIRRCGSTTKDSL